MMANEPHVDMLRAPLGRARGLGSARAGSGHWWMQRLTAVALTPLTLWFIWAVLHLTGASHRDAVVWLSGPATKVLMISLLVATFYHLSLGLQVVLEDYVHNEPAKMAGIMATKGVSWVLGLLCIIAVFKVGA